MKRLMLFGLLFLALVAGCSGSNNPKPTLKEPSAEEERKMKEQLEKARQGEGGASVPGQ